MDSVNSLSELFPVRDSASDRGPRSVEQMGSEDFLALMVAQLENQDPTKPMDDMQFMGQLAQFGTVSGIQDLQDSFSGLSSSLTASRALEAANLVGRRVATEGNVALLAPGAAPSKMRGVVSARLRCTKCAHDVSRFPGYRWRPTAAYLHFRNYHPDRARLLEEAEAADGHAAYCCQCAWLDAVELRDLGCDHAWVGY